MHAPRQAAEEAAEPTKPAVATRPRHSVAQVLALQQSAGNVAVGRMLARQETKESPADITFRNAALQAVWDANKARATTDQRTALVFLDRDVKGPWTNIAWGDVAKSTAVRIFKPEKIDQAVLGLCGPAAALNSSAEAAPSNYATLVVTIYETGKAGGKEVNKRLLGNTPPPGMDPGDWMVMSAMQDVSNAVYDYYGEHDSAQEKRRAGLSMGQLKDDLEKFSGCVNTTTYTCDFWGVLDETKKANDLLSKHGNKVVVIMFVDAGILQDENAKGTGKNHFIRVLQPIAVGDEEVEFRVFTWGDNTTYKFQKKNFERLVFDFIIGARDKSISI